MELWEALLLGLIQGLTEFIPVSSSGHLVLGQYLLGLKLTENLTFEVFVHFGTVASVLTIYGKRAINILFVTLWALSNPIKTTERYRNRKNVRFGVLILITMIPTGMVYIFFQETLESAFADPRLVSWMLMVTGVLLVLTLINPNPEGPLNPIKAFFIGVGQSFAMLPGISRSGATICTALYQKVNPEDATDFSFLMLLPVVIGATLLDVLEIVQTGQTMEYGPIAIGTVTAYLSGIVAIYVVIDFVKRGKLQYFAYYCFLLGGTGLIFI